MADNVFLIAGLGNPGARYERTRHNIGFMLVDLFANKHGMNFRFESRMRGDTAKKNFDFGKVLLLKPDTYMNLSGLSVRSVVEYYKIPLEQVLIVTDDVHLPLGQIRLRGKGSCGGHNGLENIETHLQSNHYPRMRIGVGHPADSDMADYVLQRFSSSEMKVLEKTMEKAVDAMELWLTKGLLDAMNQYNVHPQKKQKVSDRKGEKNEQTQEKPL